MTKSEIKTIANCLSDVFIADEKEFDRKINELAAQSVSIDIGYMVVALAQLYYNAKTGIITDMAIVKERQKQILKGCILNGTII